MTLPRQKIPKSLKTIEWGKSVIDEFDNIMLSQGSSRETAKSKKASYDLLNGIITPEDFEYVLNPYGIKKNEFPAELRHYDIISPKIQLLLGEEIKRPFNWRVSSKSPDATTKFLKKKTEMYIQLLNEMVAGEEQSTTPREIDKFMTYEYKDAEEKTANDILKYLFEELALARLFNIGFSDSLIVGEEIYKVENQAGRPYVRICNPLNISIIADPNSNLIEDAEVIREERWLTLSSILDEFHPWLEDKDISKLENEYRNREGTNTSGIHYPESKLLIYGEQSYMDSIKDVNTVDANGNVRVLNLEWKSMHRVGFLTNEEGDMDLIDIENFPIPDYAVKTFIKRDGKKVTQYVFDGTTVEEHWITTRWEGTKVGKDIYLKIRPVPYQRRDMDNPSISKSTYIGFIYNARNSKGTSLIQRMKPFSYLYDIIYWRTELAFAKSKGKVPIIDIAQIPKSEGFDLDLILYYMDAMGVMVINSLEKDEKSGDTSSFNQYAAQDLSMGNYINQHVLMLNKIEEQLGELSGVSRQRQGQVQTSELVGNVERAVIQSSHITEYWFYWHNEVKKSVLQALLDVTKAVWPTKKINYVASDGARLMLDLSKSEFAATEFGLFVNNSAKDDKIISTIEQLASQAVQAGTATLADIVTIMQEDSILAMKKQLEMFDQKRAESAQAAQQAEQAGIEAELQTRKEELMVKETGEEKRNIRDNETKLKIAEMTKQNGEETSEVQDDGNDPIQKEKLRIERDKLDETIRHNKAMEKKPTGGSK